MATASTVFSLPSLPPVAPILLVSRDPQLQGSFRCTLEQEGYSVEVAVSGAAAIDGLKTARPSLILLDAALTDVSSRELLSCLHELCPCVPALVLGNEPSVADKVLMFELGADD